MPIQIFHSNLRSRKYIYTRTRTYINAICLSRRLLHSIVLNLIFAFIFRFNNFITQQSPILNFTLFVLNFTYFYYSRSIATICYFVRNLLHNLLHERFIPTSIIQILYYRNTVLFKVIAFQIFLYLNCLQVRYSSNRFPSLLQHEISTNCDLKQLLQQTFRIIRNSCLLLQIPPYISELLKKKKKKNTLSNCNKIAL